MLFLYVVFVVLLLLSCGAVGNEPILHILWPRQWMPVGRVGLEAQVERTSFAYMVPTDCKSKPQ